jgi:hypothetical protein
MGSGTRRQCTPLLPSACPGPSARGTSAPGYLTPQSHPMQRTSMSRNHLHLSRWRSRHTAASGRVQLFDEPPHHPRDNRKEGDSNQPAAKARLEWLGVLVIARDHQALRIDGAASDRERVDLCALLHGIDQPVRFAATARPSLRRVFRIAVFGDAGALG